MRWLERKLYKLAWYLVKLPFRIVYYILRWAFTGKHLNRDGYVVNGEDKLEHRVIAARILGRKLERGEVVHHINGKRNDNRPSNLCVMSDQDHVRYHEWYDWIRKTYGRYPRRETQLRKLRQTFKGQILSEPILKRDRVG